jgi:RNA-binding protein
MVAAMALTGKQRRFLRGRGHHLDAIVQIGKRGVEPGVVAAVDQALLDHELIKLRLGQGTDLDRHEVAAALASATGAEVAQVLGASILLYRPHPENPTIKLPTGAAGDAGAADDDGHDEGAG